jgi:hypothetical protein
MALRDSAAWLAAEGGDELARMLLRLRLWAVYDLNELADSTRQGPPRHLTSRNNLASAQGGERAGLSCALRGA